MSTEGSCQKDPVYLLAKRVKLCQRQALTSSYVLSSEISLMELQQTYHR